ncbi:MAG: hypothetical protein IKY94_15035 [Lachnospiraceae bacterium]|nr:hypothetical protein [Lachnospiraceae bacterium]
MGGDNFPYLEYINTMGTNIIFNFSSTGGAIETALLEATGTELKIIDHSDLKNLTLQFTYEEPPNENRIHLGHNCNYSSITLDNCSNSAFSLSIKGRYKDPDVLNKDNWIEVPTQLYEKFINNYGVFSLFSKVKDLTIRNSLNPIDSEQLQPNGEIL